MVYSTALTALNATTALAANLTQIPPARIIDDEPAWRRLPAGHRAGSPQLRVIASRWHSLDQRTQEVQAETPTDRHVVAIVLRNEDVRLTIAGRVIHDGAAIAGMVQVTEPGASAKCIFRGPYDVLHLHIPNHLIAELSRDMSGRDPRGLRSESRLMQDPVSERLGRALLSAEETGDPFGQLYAECISTAVVARLLGSSCRTLTGRSKVAELARWRLRRVTEYVDANLGEAISLADLAVAAGLTRMHFAAQFRAATGLPPHEYLLRRRIERAQEMLVDRRASLVDVALSVGFQTQSHFTSVFKRFVGQPPGLWRQARGPRIAPTRQAA